MGITQGTSATTFTPSNTCTRAETVTFLYRFSAVMSAAAAVAAGDMESAVVQVGSDGTGVLITRNDSDTDGVYRAAIIVPVAITAYDDSNGGGADIRVRGGTSLNAGNDPLYVVDSIQLSDIDIRPDPEEKVQIRGIGTINDRDPIYVVDGRQGGTISVLNPADIETMTVLKDTAAMSMRGRNLFVGITQANGEPGEGATVQVKGTTTPAGSDPLDIVNGTPSVTFISLQAEFGFDIDAAAGAIFGSRAAN